MNSRDLKALAEFHRPDCPPPPPAELTGDELERILKAYCEAPFGVKPQDVRKLLQHVLWAKGECDEN